MPNSIRNEAKKLMDRTLDSLKGDLASLRAGRATPALLDKVLVDYYGASTPINQLANISAPEPRLIVIQPWDKSALPNIEKAIQKSDLGITPSNDGNVIRINIPALTEERRTELVKVVKKSGEEAKVSVRNTRRDANEDIKKMEKSGAISEDEGRRHQDEVQQLTDQYIKQVDEMIASKEKDIMSV